MTVHKSNISSANICKNKVNLVSGCLLIVVFQDEGFEVEGDMTRLRCVQCEFLKFKAEKQWSPPPPPPFQTKIIPSAKLEST